MHGTNGSLTQFPLVSGGGLRGSTWGLHARNITPFPSGACVGVVTDAGTPPRAPLPLAVLTSLTLEPH